MFDWMKHLLRTKEREEDAAVVKQEKRMEEQFSRWDETLAEVTRVQELAEGKKPSRVTVRSNRHG